MREINIARANGFYLTMAEVEKSSVPFPDDPPIVYPAAPLWEELTDRRKVRFGRSQEAQLRKERRPRRCESTGFGCMETPLGDVITYVKNHNIAIQLDTNGLRDFDVSSAPPSPATSRAYCCGRRCD